MSRAGLAHPARAREALKAQRDTRVDRIIELMAGGQWFGAHTARELAEEWRVTATTVHEYASEASTVIRRVVKEDPDLVRAMIIGGIDRVIREAHELKRVTKDGDEYAAPDLRAAVAALALKLKVYGLEAPPAPGGGDAFPSRAEALAWARGVVADLEADERAAGGGAT